MIEPGGRTHRTLNVVLNPPNLVLGPYGKAGVGLGVSVVSPLAPEFGGYLISYTTDDGANGKTPIPAGYRLLLGPNEELALDVTGRPMHQLLDAAGLARLLYIMDKFESWGNLLRLSLMVTRESQVLHYSKQQLLKCPVRPHSGRLLSENENLDLLYLGVVRGKDDSEFYGRMFKQIPGFEKYLFTFGGCLELENSKRGFDCITFAGTACGAPHKTMGGRGADLALALGAKEVVFEKTRLIDVAAKTIGEYLARNGTGYYLLYGGGHVTLVVNSQVYEFKPGRPSNRGFTMTPAAQWVLEHKGAWTLKQLPAKPPLANG
jgi:hypothetical protein